MSLILVGIGSDSKNASNCPPIFDDGSFEYIPIPEEHETSETATFENEGFDEHLDHVIHDGEKTDDLDRVHLHHDPNFEELTFGDPGKSRSALLSLEPDDILAFYTGLTPPGQTRPKHRFLIGYFTVDRVVNFRSLKRDLLEREIELNKGNAHIKRYLKRHNQHHLENLAIVQGKKPGGLLDEAIKLSGGRPDAPNYYFREKWLKAWEPSTEYLGGIKPVIRSDISKDAFLDSIKS